MKKFSENLKSARKKIGLSQKQLADKLNVATSTIGSWENNLRTPKIHTFILVAKALDVSCDFLLGLQQIKK
ncbi:MAG: helix-turn-helix transcriptional regulator [Clostridiales bacterium]|nr:helix-turn-helix transcriptional regulator [Clostridiales bacterium]